MVPLGQTTGIFLQVISNYLLRTQKAYEALLWPAIFEPSKQKTNALYNISTGLFKDFGKTSPLF